MIHAAIWEDGFFEKILRDLVKTLSKIIGRLNKHIIKIINFNSATGKGGVYDQIQTAVKIEPKNRWVQFLASAS